MEIKIQFVRLPKSEAAELFVIKRLVKMAESIKRHK